MMKLKIWSLAAVATSVQVSATPPAPTMPGKWTVNYAEQECTATRRYGAGEGALALLIKPGHSGGSMRLVLANAWTKLSMSEFTATIDFEDGLAAFKTDTVPALTFGPARAALIIDLPVTEVARLRAAREIRIHVPGVITRTVQTGPSVSLFKALDKCLADLRTFWGLAADAPLRPATAAKTDQNLDRLFSWSNYPTVDFHQAKTNAASVRLLVNQLGSVRDCLILSGTGSAALDIQTCQVFERSISYQPARDAAGKAIRSAVDATIRWRR